MMVSAAGFDLQEAWGVGRKPTPPVRIVFCEGRFYGRGGDEAMDNLVDAIPVFPDPHMSTIAIWHASAVPKLKFTAALRFLKNWAEDDDQLERVGGATGPQFYRWVPDEVKWAQENAARLATNATAGEPS